MDNNEGSGNAIQAVKDLFNAAINEDQHDQFWALTSERKAGIGLSMLVEVASWLAEEYTSRPTGPSSGSGPSAKPTGSASMDGALRAVTTYSKPEPVGLTT
jgi:hypothetical protein